MMKYIDEKILCEIYELFYWTEPDFKNSNIDIEIHSMMRILWHFGIILSDVGFSINSTVEQFPFNDEIELLIDNLKKIKQENIKEIKLQENTIMKIQIASIELHKKAQESEVEFTDLVLEVSKIIHANEQVLPGKEGNDISKLEYINYEKDNIDSVLSLVKNIDKEIEKNLKDKKAN